MKIFILDAFHPAGIEYARQHAELVLWDDPRARNWAEEADAIMVRMTRIGAADLARAKQLKVICKQGAGFDTIDIEAAKAHGIPVLRTPGANSEAVAEIALTLALSVARRTNEMDQMLRAGAKIVRPDILGLEMWGKTVGIVGLGAIGSRVAKKWAGAFDARICYVDPNVSNPAYRKFPVLEEMLPEVDVLTLHAPLLPETRNLIGKKQLGLMKPTAILVNAARGGMVDEAALYDALRAGRLFGAGLDVWEVEPPAKDHPLLQLPNVVGTPHAAAGTRETQERSSLQAAAQVVEVLQGKPPRNTVT